MNTSIVSDIDVQALIDNDIEDEIKVKVLNALKLNPGLQDRYDQLVRQKQLICAAFAEDAEMGRLH